MESLDCKSIMPHHICVRNRIERFRQGKESGSDNPAWEAVKASVINAPALPKKCKRRLLRGLQLRSGMVPGRPAGFIHT
jgi:hypothetical protein